MAITSTDVQVIAPELTWPTNAQWTVWIADAYGELNTSAWPAARLDRAAKYLVAHLATWSGLKGHLPASEEHVGPVGRSYSISQAMTDLMLTAYGQEYRRMMRQIAQTWQVL